MRKTIHHSQIRNISLNRVKFNDGMEILMWDGWYKVLFDNNHAYLQYGIPKNKNKKKTPSR